MVPGGDDGQSTIVTLWRVNASNWDGEMMSTRLVAVALGVLLAVSACSMQADPSPVDEQDAGGVDVPGDWVTVEVDGLQLSHPPDYTDSELVRAQVPEAILALEGPEEDGTRPALFVTSVTPGSTTDLTLRTDLVKQILPDAAPGFEITRDERIEIPGDGGAQIIAYNYPRADERFSTDAVQAIIASGSRGWGLRYSFDSDFFDAEVADQIIASLRVVDAQTS